MNTKGMNYAEFWQAVEAVSEEEFDRACQNASAPKLIAFKQFAEKWVRCFIWKLGIRRFGFRTNNLSESLNNALKGVRRAPLLHVLLHTFRYTTRKFNEYRNHASLYKSRWQNDTAFTDYALRLFASNDSMASNCRILMQSDSEWQVEDSRRTFNVYLSSSGEYSCSCLRYFDEDMPCQHILKVLDHTGRLDTLPQLIGKIYLKDNFKQAFLQTGLFWPKDSDLYLPNPRVVPSCQSPQRGAPRVRRFAGPGENPKSHSVSRPPSGRDPRDSVSTYEPSTDMLDINSKDIDSHHFKRCAIERCLAEHGCLDEDCSMYAMEFLNSLESCSTDEDCSVLGSDIEIGLTTKSFPSKDVLVDCHRSNSPNGFEQERNVSTPNESASGRRKDVQVVDQKQIETSCCSKDVVDLSRVGHVPKSRIILRGPTFLWNRGSFPKKRARDDVVDSTRNKLAKKTSCVNVEIVPRTISPVHQSNESKQHSDEEKDSFLRILCHHDDDIYELWEGFYNCAMEVPDGYSWGKGEIPDLYSPLLFPVRFDYPRELINCYQIENPDGEQTAMMVNPHLIHLSDSIEFSGTTIISLSLFRKFLARTHHFTAIGLEAQAIAYRRGRNGVVKYLAFYPQISTPTSVTDRGGDGPSYVHAFKVFDELDPNPEQVEYHPVFWMHTHPRWSAYMSHIDIFQLFQNRSEGYTKGIVFSPRQTGVKMLCVDLTKEGLTEIDRLRGLYRVLYGGPKPVVDEKDFLLESIRDSSTKFYTRIPFSVDSCSCFVADFRERDEVCRPIIEYVEKDKADWCWFH